MNIAIASDHAGYNYKEKLVNHLTSLGHTIEDFGCHSTESMAYPDTAHPMALSVESKKNELGIAICGSGNGISMTANKHQGIRAALCWNVELAELARQHNDANVLGLPARFISYEEARDITEKFLSTEFEGGRHKARVDKIALS